MYAHITTEEEYDSGAHKIPHDIWSAYEKTLEEQETTKKTEQNQGTNELIQEEIASAEESTEGLEVAGMMSYASTDAETHHVPASPADKNQDVASVSVTDDQKHHHNKEDKTFEIDHNPSEQSVSPGNIQIHTFGVEQLIPLRKQDGKYKKKADTKTKKREDWIKNWVARKYNKPKFPRGPLPSFVPTSQLDLASIEAIEAFQQENTEQPEALPSVQPDRQPAPESASSLFAPTVPPKQPPKAILDLIQPSANAVPLTHTNDLKTSLLEKYSSARNNLVKPSRFITNNKGVNEETAPINPFVNSGVPRGAKANVFKKYAGDKLSQADFERQILGVSTATEISVKSMICVKGKCFNADDMSKMFS